MSRVLLISSYTADSSVGGQVSAFVLRRMGMDVTWLPTTLFGRHPGWGDPGGQATHADTLSTMWAAIKDQIKQQERQFDAVMTGYMGSTAHVALAAEIIDVLKPKTVLVDPVMGDGTLYVDEDRAEAICDQLIPRAHICTPNLWEWRYITGSLRDDPPRQPSRLTGVTETLITSVARQSNAHIGARLFYGKTPGGCDIVHDRFETVPHGGGDALAAAYLAHRLEGVGPETAFQLSVSAIFRMMQSANAAGDRELPLIREQEALTNPPILPIQPFSAL